MALSSSSLFVVQLSGSALSPSIKNKLENNEAEAPSGLVKRLVIPDLDDGVLPVGFKLRGGLTISSFGLMHCLLSWSLEVGFLWMAVFIAVASGIAAALLSDGPVKRCTTSLKVSVSVWTNVVTGLQVATFWLPWLFICKFFSDRTRFDLHLCLFFWASDLWHNGTIHAVDQKTKKYWTKFAK